MSTIEGMLSVAMADLFRPRLRYSGTAIGYNLMFALLGGTAPLVAIWLTTATGDLTALVWCVAIALVVLLVCGLVVRPGGEG